MLVASAAFVGGRLLGSPDTSSGDQEMVVFSSGDVKTGLGVLLDVEHAPEMPDGPADVAGLFLRREDNSIYVGTGNLSGVLVGGKWERRHDGPKVEVLATHDTLVYRDDMFRQLGGVAPSGSVKQVLKLISLDEVGEDTTIQAWGNRRGDRLVAEVIVFAPNP
jgi:hypothetical protein